MCRACDVRFACNGGCPKERLITTPEGEVLTLPVHEIHAFHALNEELLERLRESARSLSESVSAPSQPQSIRTAAASRQAVL